MKRITINNADDLKKFIQTQEDSRQQAFAVFITSRAALRLAVFPLRFFQLSSAVYKNDLTSIFNWRGYLLSSLATLRMEHLYESTSVDIVGSLLKNSDYVADIERDAFEILIFLFDIIEDKEHWRLLVSLEKHSPNEIWAQITIDAELWFEHADQGDGTLAINIAPLWSNENPLEQDWHALREKLLAADTPDPRGADWSFWVKWYDDILAGNPQNWDMLHEIATTDAIDWDAYAREVNDTINLIVERYRFRDEVVALRREVEQLRSATQYPPRNHNNPPELVANAPEVQEHLTIVWAAAFEAEKELGKPKPDPTILSKVGNIILDFGIWFAQYCGKKTDLAIDSTLTTVIKWGIPAGGGYLLASNPQKVAQLGKQLMNFASKLGVF